MFVLNISRPIFFEKKKKYMNKIRTTRKEQIGKGGKINLNTISGTRDFPPNEMLKRNWLTEKWKKKSKSFAFEEYDCPILEEEALYTRKSGEEIVKQMYNFVDKSGLKVTLRPEMTPSVVRLIMQQSINIRLPLKWFSVPQCWRYETTTKGRKREFYQWNCDIFGVKEVTAEVELISLIIEVCRDLGLTSDDVIIRVSSRKLVQCYIENFLNISKDKTPKIFSIIDKLEKVDKNDMIKMLNNETKDEKCSLKILEFINTEKLEDLAKICVENDPMKSNINELNDFFNLIMSYKLQDWVKYDPRIVRGLTYYTGIVFEAFPKGTIIKRAIAGGGRYDSLFQSFGEEKVIPSTGFGFGDCVIMAVLAEKKKMPNFERIVDDVVIPYNFGLINEASQIALKLRKSGRIVDIYLKKIRKLRTAFEYADKLNATRVIFIAPEELRKRKVKVRYLKEHRECEEDIDLLLDNIQT